MRKDMDKLLVTTPRIGSSLKNKEIKEARRSAREGDYDNLPRNSSMKPKSRKWSERKEFNEYLKPLVRYLKKNCGRPWDKVYSEICENMDRRGVVQDHIFQHLFDFVERNPIFKDGKPHSTGYGVNPIYKNDWTFYVDKDGTLREPKDKRPPWRGESDEKRKLIATNNPSVFLFKRKTDGTWFKVSLVEAPPVDDIYEYSYYPEWIPPIQGDAAVGKRGVVKTLSKREKKAYGVK